MGGCDDDVDKEQTCRSTALNDGDADVDLEDDQLYKEARSRRRGCHLS